MAEAINQSGEISDLDELNESARQQLARACEVIDKEIVDKWTKEQVDLQEKLQLQDTEPWQLSRQVYSSDTTDPEEYSNNPNKFLRYVAGMDISFVKNDKLACSGLFVFDLSEEMRLVYQDLDTELITMDQPYAPGFLAYREAPFLLKKLEKLRADKPHLYPQCIFIDGLCIEFNS
jgi:deoxyinosine 3'endonuclease (endonuclease V)